MKTGTNRERFNSGSYRYYDEQEDILYDEWDYLMLEYEVQERCIPMTYDNQTGEWTE